MWFFKKNDSVKVKIFMEGKEVDLDTLTDFHLTELAEAVAEHWKTPTDSQILFEVKGYLECYCCQPRKTVLEVACYQKDQHHIKGRRRIAMPSAWRKKKTQASPVLLVPPKVLVKSWPSSIEAQFI